MLFCTKHTNKLSDEHYNVQGCLRAHQQRPSKPYPFVKTEKVGLLKCMLSFLSTACERIHPRPFFRLIPASGTHPSESRPRGGQPQSVRVAPPSSGPLRARLGLDGWGKLA